MRVRVPSLVLASILLMVAETATAGARQTPAAYGTSVVSYVHVPAVEFFPSDSTCTYLTDNIGFGARWDNGSCQFLYAGVHLPAGAKLVSLEMDFVDTNSLHILGSLVECDNYGQNCTLHPATAAGPADCQAPGYVCSGNAFNGGPGSQTADLTPDGITVDNNLKSYRLASFQSTTDAGNRIGGMIVGYVLQVSPAPATPSFGDVPVTDPAFQFIEALAASGITVGCGGGNYCPDAPVTRRQMAVYLAKALGLQWQ